MNEDAFRLNLSCLGEGEVITPLTEIAEVGLAVKALVVGVDRFRIWFTGLVTALGAVIVLDLVRVATVGVASFFGETERELARDDGRERAGRAWTALDEDVVLPEGDR